MTEPDAVSAVTVTITSMPPSLYAEYAGDLCGFMTELQAGNLPAPFDPIRGVLFAAFPDRHDKHQVRFGYLTTLTTGREIIDALGRMGIEVKDITG